MSLPYNFAGIVAGLSQAITAAGGTPQLVYEKNFKGIIEALEDLQVAIAGISSGSVNWGSPGQIGANAPNTGQFTQLNTGTVHLVEKQLKPQLRDIISTNGQITRVSIYSTPAKTTELYRKTLNYTSGTLTSTTETDYTTNPPTTRTKTLTRVNGQITTVEVV